MRAILGYILPVSETYEAYGGVYPETGDYTTLSPSGVYPVDADLIYPKQVDPGIVEPSGGTPYQTATPLPETGSYSIPVQATTQTIEPVAVALPIETETTVTALPVIPGTPTVRSSDNSIWLLVGLAAIFLLASKRKKK